MKKTLILSLIATLLLGAPALAESAPSQPAKSDLSASAAGSQDSVATPQVITKKQKIEIDLRATSLKLKDVADRIQNLIDLLSKKNKDVSGAQASLDNANASLAEANLAIDQYAGIFPVETKNESTDSDATKTKEVTIYKDPLKKAQDSLKAVKASLIDSIASLKESLI